MNFEQIGIIFATLASWAVLMLLLGGVCMLSNRVSHMALDCYGGWKAFMEYRKWYFERMTIGEQT